MTTISSAPVAGIVLAAGSGTRMRSLLPKVLHEVAGRPMVGHVVTALGTVGPDRIVVVVGPGMEEVSRCVAPHRTVLQQDRRGTGHAVMMAREALQDFVGDVVVLYGDVPLVRGETVGALVEARRQRAGTAVAVLGFRPADPTGYGRLIQNPDGGLERIVEHKDATAQERRIDLCNSGLMAIDATKLFPLLDRLRPDNAQGEYYLTDVVGLARGDGHHVAVIETAADEVMGVNSRSELAAAEAVAQRRLRDAAMAGGVTLRDPATVYLSADTVLGRDVTIGQQVVIGPGVRIADGAEIRPFSHLEGAEVGEGAVVGPFARLRPGAKIGTDAHIGNFVEIKNATVEDGAKANHLSYIGDARVGAKANIGAGTITCNYDGFLKSRTDIGAGAFIGSNSALVAPVSIGDRAIVGAGSVITQDVPADAIAATRAPQTERPGAAARYRERQAAKKAAARK